MLAGVKRVKERRGTSRRAWAVALAVAIAVALGGCGGSGGSGTTTPQSGRPSAPSVNRTGTKPQEVTTKLHLSRGDCALLAAALRKRTGEPVRASSQPHPPHSECRLQGKRTTATVTLDTSYGAHQRYFNRVTETQQFGAPDPAKMPHPMPGVGEPGVYGQSANWIPALGTLLAVRGNRWVTVNYAAAGESRPARKAAAAAVARRAFRLSAR
jgi:hypothetical protein